MGDPKGKTGRYAFGHGPPAKIFLGMALGMFLLNHLIVVLGGGMFPEVLVAGSWLGLMAVWAGLAGRSFDVISGWARRSARREIGLGFMTFAIAIGLAEAVAWFGYRQHLVD